MTKTGNRPKSQAKTATTKLLSKIPKGTFEQLGGLAGLTLGTAAGSRMGAPAWGGQLGGAVGRGLGSAAAELTGFGDYTVENNSLARVGTVLDPGVQAPRISNADGAWRIRHCEFVKDISAPTNPLLFNNQTFAINPADANTFPWLADIAARFQQWKPIGMVALFQTNTSNYSATGALGKLALASNYDTHDAPYSNMSQVLNSKYSTSASPAQSQIHTFECMPSKNPMHEYYVRSRNAENIDSDRRLEDLCRFQLCTEGLPMAAGQILGGLWISYEIELIKPTLEDSLGMLIAYQGVSRNGDAFLVNTDIPIGLPYASIPSNNRLNFLVNGYYLLSMSESYDAPAAVPIATAVGNILVTDIASHPYSAKAGGTNVYKIYVYGRDGYVTFGDNTVNFTAVRIVMTPISYGVYAALTLLP